jgi:cell wall-associated NlpC family hydrolase
MVLSGTDGATYTYRDVTASLPRRARVHAGTPIGVSGPGGFTFSISVPDVRGEVDAGEALQAWAAGLSINVRSLPSTIAPASAPTRDRVLLITDPGAGTAAAEAARSMAGRFVTVRTAAMTASTVQALTTGGHQLLRRRALMVVVLANATPAQARALAARLPAGQHILWVAPPATTPGQAAAYRAIAAVRPGFRVESLSAALTAASAPVRALATATLVSAYASAAYRLPSVTTGAGAAVTWAEQQLGKPYKWAAAGPGSFDCSGLTMDALAQAGIAVWHNANAQWRQTRASHVAENRLAAGDLVFFAGSDGTMTTPGHVGIYVGDGEIIDAPFTGAKVRFDPLASIGGYVGATDPYRTARDATAPVPVGATGVSGVPPAAGRLSQYQGFAQTLADNTWGPGQFGYLNLLWERESAWNPDATNPVSGAFGIPQALPAMKMASAGLDWATNPYTQIIWGIGYIRAAYGTPRTAWAHEVAFGWY